MNEESENSSGNEERPMWPITCTDCGTETEVPFEPDGERPVYCQDCYRRRRPPRRSRSRY
ncbi:MAG: CxxC-x17-CxxC domain-containing protein [Candidatus Kariarchaeaceae archaeon]